MKELLTHGSEKYNDGQELHIADFMYALESRPIYSRSRRLTSISL